MAKKKSVKSLNIKNNIETNLNEINIVENYISDILTNDNFNKLNIMQNNQNLNLGNAANEAIFKVLNEHNENIEFISVDKALFEPYKNLITEKEFYKIVGFNKNKLSARSGTYQESLFGRYLDAKESQDSGYISDILNKAIIFQNNLNYVKSLMKSKHFMKEWRKDFGNISPCTIFKQSGNLRKINIIKERID